MTDNGSNFGNKLLETLAMGSLQNLMNSNTTGNNQGQQPQYNHGKGGGGNWFRGGRGLGHSLRQQHQGPGLHEKVDKLSETLENIAKAQPQLFGQQAAFHLPTQMPTLSPGMIWYSGCRDLW